MLAVSNFDPLHSIDDDGNTNPGAAFFGSKISPAFKRNEEERWLRTREVLKQKTSQVPLKTSLLIYSDKIICHRWQRSFLRTFETITLTSAFI
ncbi:hypothetical protein O181_019851 [Austropuccinia psidii MF-1]|uniref:Uncharacterized protein n=1 Tax=Austropuccinia psidii MF-1 TaxID=1389203 RepID=A0A9Q3C807_9BASI|nr:hypothetical protein [Austropuccinia psidii MF-1]